MLPKALLQTCFGYLLVFRRFATRSSAQFLNRSLQLTLARDIKINPTFDSIANQSTLDMWPPKGSITKALLR